MKLTYFLRGLGAGIIVTALVLSIAYRNGKPAQNVVEQAKELGMVFPEGTAVPAAETGTPAPSAAAWQDPASSPDSGQTPHPKASSARETKGAEKTKAPDEGVRGTRFTVRGGLLSSSVAREMMEAGIIKSDKALDEYLEKSGTAREIRAGTYFIPAGASYEEIARIITGKGGS